MVKLHVYSKKGTNFENQLTDALFFSTLEKKYSVSKTDFLKFLSEKNKSESFKPFVDGVPVFILCNQKLSSLESIVKYLRENKHLSYLEIGDLISRNSKSLAVSYAVSKNKMPELFVIPHDDVSILIPFNAFKKELSILESISVYLKSLNYSYSDIARMLNKDPRTIWTVCNRANKKFHSNDVFESKEYGSLNNQQKKHDL